MTENQNKYFAGCLHSKILFFGFSYSAIGSRPGNASSANTNVDKTTLVSLQLQLERARRALMVELRTQSEWTSALRPYTHYLVTGLFEINMLSHWAPSSRKSHTLGMSARLWARNIHLYHFILKYNICTFTCKLPNFLKFGWLLLNKPFARRLYRPHSDLKHGYRLENVFEAIESVKLLWETYQFLVKNQVLWSNIDSIIYDILVSRYMYIQNIIRACTHTRQLKNSTIVLNLSGIMGGPNGGSGMERIRFVT